MAHHTAHGASTRPASLRTVLGKVGEKWGNVGKSGEKMPKIQPLPTVKLCHVCAGSLHEKSQAAKTYVHFDEVMEVGSNCDVCRDIFKKSDEEKGKCSVSLSDYCRQISCIRILDNKARFSLSLMKKPIVVFLKSRASTMLSVMLVEDGWQAPQEVSFFWSAIAVKCPPTSFFFTGVFPIS